MTVQEAADKLGMSVDEVLNLDSGQLERYLSIVDKGKQGWLDRSEPVSGPNIPVQGDVLPVEAMIDTTDDNIRGRKDIYPTEDMPETAVTLGEDRSVQLDALLGEDWMEKYPKAHDAIDSEIQKSQFASFIDHLKDIIGTTRPDGEFDIHFGQEWLRGDASDRVPAFFKGLADTEDTWINPKGSSYERPDYSGESYDPSMQPGNILDVIKAIKAGQYTQPNINLNNMPSTPPPSVSVKNIQSKYGQDRTLLDEFLRKQQLNR